MARMDEDVLRVLAATPVVPVADNYMDKAAANLAANPRAATCGLSAAPPP